MAIIEGVLTWRKLINAVKKDIEIFDDEDIEIGWFDFSCSNFFKDSKAELIVFVDDDGKLCIH